MESSIDPLFATLVASVDLFDRVDGNDELADWIRERAATSKLDGSYSNVGGWHSLPITRYGMHPAVDEITGIACQHAGILQRRAMGMSPAEIETTVWLNLNRSGDYNLTHNHRSTWSFVYYVAVPAIGSRDRRAGALELLDPRPATSCVTLASVGRRFFQPRVGRLIVFPGWVMHTVHPFEARGDRISIAGDIVMREKLSLDRPPLLERIQLELVRWLDQRVRSTKEAGPSGAPPRLHAMLRELEATGGPDQMAAVLEATDHIFERLVDCELPVFEQELPSEPSLFAAAVEAQDRIEK